MFKPGCFGRLDYSPTPWVIIVCGLMVLAFMLEGCGASPSPPASTPTLTASVAPSTRPLLLATPPPAGAITTSGISAVEPTKTAMVKAATISPTSILTPAVTATATTAGYLFSLKRGKTLLKWAEELVQKVKPADTSYEHKTGSVSWAGQDGAETYTSHTDCSGLIIALLSQTYHLTPNDYQRWLHTARPLAETFYQAITTQTGFSQIERIQQIEPGDILAIRYPPGYGGDNTGHIMLIAAKPQPHPVSKPQVAGTVQWDVAVIDSSESGHGAADTRHRADGTFGEGLGQGVFRLYTDEQGQMLGYTWSDFANSDYYDQQSRAFAVGRLNPAFKLP